MLALGFFYITFLPKHLTDIESIFGLKFFVELFPNLNVTGPVRALPDLSLITLATGLLIKAYFKAVSNRSCRSSSV